MNGEQLALVASVAALMISGLALRAAQGASLQALRTEVRRCIDQARAEANSLVERADSLMERTLLTASETAKSDGDTYKPNEQDAIDLRRDAGQPLSELEALDTDLNALSKGKLSRKLEEASRIRRTIAGIDTKIDIKTAALNELVEAWAARGSVPTQKAQLRPVDEKPAVGKDTASEPQ